MIESLKSALARYSALLGDAVDAHPYIAAPTALSVALSLVLLGYKIGGWLG